MDYVKRYLSLDAQASAAESKVEEYRERAEHDRWEQCRIAYEAIESGGFNRRSFAEAVGRSAVHVGRQVTVWADWGEVTPSTRPPYKEAFSESAMGKSHDAENDRKRLQDAKRVLNDPELLAQLPASAIAKAVATHPDAARAVARNPEAREAIEDEAIEVHATQHGTPEERKAALAESARRVRQFGHDVGRGMGVDSIVTYLRGAASDIAHASLHREEFGETADPEGEAEALAQIHRQLRVYEGKAEWADRDVEFLASVGIELGGEG